MDSLMNEFTVQCVFVLKEIAQRRISSSIILVKDALFN